MGLSIALGFLKLQKVKAQKLLNFDQNHLKLFGTGEELLKDSGKNIPVKYFSKMWYFWLKNMEGMTDKVEFLHRGQSDPALQNTSKQLCYQSPPSWCKYLPNIFIH